MHNYKEDMSSSIFSFRIIFAFLTLACLSSCISSRLTVYTDYLSKENLASYFVDTPDPYLNNPTIGQRLIVIWTLKKRHLLYQDLHLSMTIRFRNKKEITLTHPINHPKGTYVYCLLNQDYIDHDGIITYKVELVGNGQILDEWRHQIWTELILVGQKNSIDPQGTGEEEREGKEFEFEELDI